MQAAGGGGKRSSLLRRRLPVPKIQDKRRSVFVGSNSDYETGPANLEIDAPADHKRDVGM